MWGVSLGPYGTGQCNGLRIVSKHPAYSPVSGKEKEKKEGEKKKTLTRRAECSPRVPGHEIIGKVVAVGEEEKVWKVGDRAGGPWHAGHDGEHTHLPESLQRRRRNPLLIRSSQTRYL